MFCAGNSFCLAVGDDRNDIVIFMMTLNVWEQIGQSALWKGNSHATLLNFLPLLSKSVYLFQLKNLFKNKSNYQRYADILLKI